jgi:hypothetical protein
LLGGCASSLLFKDEESSIHGLEIMHNDLILLGVLLLSAGIAVIGGWGFYKLADHKAALLLIIPELIPVITFLISLRYLVLHWLGVDEESC